MMMMAEESPQLKTTGNQYVDKTHVQNGESIKKKHRRKNPTEEKDQINGTPLEEKKKKKKKKKKNFSG